mgnify:CR=1 FL=1
MNIVEKSLTDLSPYENNPRNNDNAVDAVAASIQQFGFKVPIVIDSSGVIVAGHTRFKAAKRLGLVSVPCIIADDLSPAQIKAFRLADNKVSELATWDNSLLYAELEDLADWDLESFGFGNDLWQKRQAWRHIEKKCNLKRHFRQQSNGDFLFTSFFDTGKEGVPISAIKDDFSNVKPFADCLCDFICRAFGSNLAKGSWCLLTTPRRRHKDGFHFSTEICKLAANYLHLPFYQDAITAENRNRILPEFHLVIEPAEFNCLLFDDIITTGKTIETARQLLLAAGHPVFSIISIKNSSKG